MTLDYGENATGVDFDVIDVTGSISGTVSTEADGVSVESLTVTATPVAEGLDAITGTTASDGTYTIDAVPPGSYVVTVEVGEGQLTVPGEASVEVGNSEDVADVDFAIVEGGSISGEVTTSLENTSVEGLTVTAEPDAEGEDAVTTTTASDGTYAFPLLLAGKYTITVTVGAGLATNPASAGIDLAANGEETADFEIVEAS